MSSKQAVQLLKQTYTKWSDHKAPRLGASVAFYSILSFAPLLLLLTAVIALIFGHASAQGALVNEARQVIGDRGADTVQTLLKNAQKPASGVFATIVAFITLLFGASGVFTELQDALNIMWDANVEAASGFMGMIRQKLFSFGMVLSVGFLLLVSLILSAGLAFLGRYLGHLLPMPPLVLQALNFVVSFVTISVLFALMFKYVPSAKVPWRDAVIGGIGTALLFAIGKQLLGLYLGKASVGSAYGAAGSLVAVVVWIYYSAQIFFFGAEFTRVLGESRGTATQPSAKAAQPPVKDAPAKAAANTPKQSGPSTGIAAAPARTARPSEPPAPARVPVTAVSHAAPPVAAAATKPATYVEVPGRRTPIVVQPAALQGRKSVPKLLMAAGMGFALGRLAKSAANNHRH